MCQRAFLIWLERTPIHDGSITRSCSLPPSFHSSCLFSFSVFSPRYDVSLPFHTSHIAKLILDAMYKKAFLPWGPSRSAGVNPILTQKQNSSLLVDIRRQEPWKWCGRPLQQRDLIVFQLYWTTSFNRALVSIFVVPFQLPLGTKFFKNSCLVFFYISSRILIYLLLLPKSKLENKS